MADLLVLLRPAKSVQNGPGFSGKNLNILSLPKRKEWPQCHRESSWQELQSRLCQKEKEQSRLSKAPDHEGEDSQGGREPHLGEKEGDQSKSMERKGWTPPWRKADSKKGGKARRASLEQVEGSMSGRVDAKALQDDL